jgi:HPr kinase/phosphorylase
VHPGAGPDPRSTELGYLHSLGIERAREGIEGFLSAGPACVIVTKGQHVPMDLLEIGNRAGVPILRTPLISSKLIDGVERVMEYALAPLVSIHGVLVDVLGVGVLLQGKSGLGKSEAALELVMRGFRLVADDLVEVRRIAGEVLVGFASELIKHHMEIRGLGIINIKDMFGVAAVRTKRRSSWCSSSVAGTRTRPLTGWGWTRCRSTSWGCLCPCCGSRFRPGATSAR